MKRLLRSWVLLSVMVLGLTLIAGFKSASAQEHFSYVGRVITLYGSTLSVEADNGNIMYFVVGRRMSMSLPESPPSANGYRWNTFIDVART